MLKINLINIAAVGLGSMAGGICRYLVTALASRIPLLCSMPLGTFAANTAGCFLIGFFSSLLPPTANQSLRLLLTVGFCGGFTTFSTFINENDTLLQSSRPGATLAYTAISLLAALMFLWLGQCLGKTCK